MAAPTSDWLRPFDFSSEIAEQNSAKLDRKQDLNFRICVFQFDQKSKFAALANPSKRLHVVLSCTTCDLLGLLFLFERAGRLASVQYLVAYFLHVLKQHRKY